MGIEYVSTICPYCSCGCGIYLVVQDGKIIGQEPWKEHPINEGANCPKGKNAYHYLYSQDRLRMPLVRKKGSLRETSWDEALDLVSSRFKEATPDTFGALGSGKTSNEESYLLQKFARVVMGTNTVEYVGRLCHSSAVAALIPAVGSGVMQTSQPEIEFADCILLAGVNLMETFPMIARRVFRARARGAKVIYTDPRKTPTARHLADIHLQLRAGTDVALINAMMRTILDEGLEDKDFIASRTAGFDELGAFLSRVDLQAAEEITGVTQEKIREAAITFAKAEKACILYDQGICQHTVGADNVRVHADLALLTGNIGKPGTGVNSMRGQISGEGSGDMGCLAVFYPGFKRVGEESAKFFEEAWGVSNLPTKPGFTYIDMLYKCPYLYIVGTDPMMCVPDVNNLKQALEKASFLVVQDIFPTEIAKLAHVVLPAATWVEREGTHTYVDRRVQKIDRVIDPPGEAKPDWWIISQLAERMGHKDKFDFSSAGEIFEEVRSCVPQYKGVTYERLKKTPGGIHWPCPSEDHPGTPTMFLQKFNTADGLGHFQVVQFKPPAESPDEEYPYALTTGRSIFHYHTGTIVVAVRARDGNRYDGVPVLVSDPKEIVKTAGALHCTSPNIARFLKEYLNGAFDQRIAVVVKPCDAKAIIELAKRNQVALDHLLLLGVNCTGTLPSAKAKKMLEGEFKVTPADVVAEDIEGSRLTIRLGDGTEKEKDLDDLEQRGYGRRENCRRCETNIPRMADIACGKWGAEDKNATFIEVCSEKGSDLIEAASQAGAINLEQASAEAVETRRKKDEAARELAYRWQESDFDSLEQMTADERFNYWFGWFSRCIKCYGCRDACPICYCKDCFLEADRGLVPPGEIPPDIVFPMVRTTHVMDSCVNCGQCQDACTMELPLSRLTFLLSRKLGRIFKYDPGTDVSQLPPLRTVTDQELSMSGTEVTCAPI